jgi:hypothetical protein
VRADGRLWAYGDRGRRIDQIARNLPSLRVGLAAHALGDQAVGDGSARQLQNGFMTAGTNRAREFSEAIAF